MKVFKAYAAFILLAWCCTAANPAVRLVGDEPSQPRNADVAEGDSSKGLFIASSSFFSFAGKKPSAAPAKAPSPSKGKEENDMKKGSGMATPPSNAKASSSEKGGMTSMGAAGGSAIDTDDYDDDYSYDYEYEYDYDYDYDYK